MAFEPDLIQDDVERDKVASLDAKDEVPASATSHDACNVITLFVVVVVPRLQILRDAINLRAQDKQKICEAYEKFRSESRAISHAI